ncbi:MAG TPA: c-type cytochrome [Myxococcales bacterium]|nr:c-type cytochrome [Myxococcales bacterium]
MRSHLKLLLLGLICAAAARAEVDKKAERNWKSKCASCHGADGKGQTDQGKKMQVEDMSAASWQKAKTDAQIKTAIEDGAKKGDAVMEGFKDKLDPASIDALTQYVRTLGGTHAAKAKKAKKAKKATP